ncbi:MAG: hypothetical protein QM781_21905 [Chitinophagaceae bacterium]
MKKILLITSMFLISAVSLWAQDDDEDGGNEKIRDKMNEYIQQRLNLSDAEAKKFTPVFLEYFKEWRKALQDNKGPEKRLDREKKVIDLRLRYRGQFQEILGEKRGNQVFNQQDRFIQELRLLRQNRPANNPRPLRRGG